MNVADSLVELIRELAVIEIKQRVKPIPRIGTKI